MNPDTSNPYEVEIIPKLQALRQDPPRDPQKAARGREQFLILAGAASRSARPDQGNPVSGQPITDSPAKRLKGWIEQITHLSSKKERFAMIPTLATILFSLTLLFGGAGATVYAAQDSLPDDPLYPIKTWSEDLRLELASAPSTQIDLALDFANRRMEEMSDLTAEGSVVPAQVAERWQQQVEFALALAAGQSSADLGPLLLRIREQLRIQDQLLTQLRQHNPDEAAPLMAQVQTRLRERLRLVEAGLEDPLDFQHHYRYGPAGRPDDLPEGSYGPGDQYSPGPGIGPEDGSGEQYGPGPGAGDNPDDGSGEGYGPGPGECTQDCDGEQYGPGPGAGDGSGEQYGPGPGAGDGPEDGTGEVYGPGPGDCTGDCEQKDGGQHEDDHQHGGGNGSGDPGNPDDSGEDGGGNGGKP